MRRCKHSAAAQALAAVIVAAAIGTPVHAASPEFSGQTRPEWVAQPANGVGPIAAADAVQPGLVAEPPSGALWQTELRARGGPLSAVATLQTQGDIGGPTTSSAWFDELYASGEAGGWQFSGGRRIVGWDVGYGFRPNDIVEQEPRRLLLPTTPTGRPLVEAEHFDASTSWTLVAVNPNQPRRTTGAAEPALATRYYRRDGAADEYLFGRWGARTGASVGAAGAWVGGESLELHASARWIERADGQVFGATPTALVATDPWVGAPIRHTAQALIGATWTNAAQVSVIAEAWWDGTALTEAQWNAWSARNAALAALVGRAPAPAVAGNLAWQAQAFDASSNLRRANLFLRGSWQQDKWQPAIDMLYTPADGGREFTAELGWQGDRLRVDAGLRQYGGPAGAVLAQLPNRRIAFVAVTVPF